MSSIKINLKNNNPEDKLIENTRNSEPAKGKFFLKR